MITKRTKFHFNSEIILSKEFKIVYKGYDADEIDSFLDLIIDDYHLYEEENENHVREINSLVEKNEQLKKQITGLILELDEKSSFDSSKKNTKQSNVSVDFMERFSRIEGIVLGEKKEKKEK